LLGEAERRGLSSSELLAVAEHHWPQPRLVPEPAGPGNAGGRLRPLAWTHRPRRQAVGLVEKKRQP